MDTFAKNLDRMMRERKLTVREAAKSAGVPLSTLQGWRSGTPPKDYVAVKRLAKALGTTLAYLLTGEEDEREGVPPISEVFTEDGEVFDGFLEVKIKRLIPRHQARAKK